MIRTLRRAAADAYAAGIMVPGRPALWLLASGRILGSITLIYLYINAINANKFLCECCDHHEVGIMGLLVNFRIDQ